MNIQVPGKSKRNYLSIALLAISTVSGCALDPAEFTRQKPGFVTDLATDSSPPLLAEKATLRDNQLRLEYHDQGQDILASAVIPQDPGDKTDGASGSLYLQQAISKHNGIPVVELSRVDEESSDIEQADTRVLPIAGITMWQEFRDRLIALVTPQAYGRGVVIEFLKQDEVFFYFDSTGQFRSSRVSEKPAQYTIDGTFKFSELSDHASKLLKEYITVADGSDAGKVLFNTGDQSSVGYPFVYADQASGQMIFVQRPMDMALCCEKASMMLPQALVHTTDSHVTGFLKQPLGSIARLFTLVVNRIVDTLTPKPLALLKHHPIQPLGENEPMDSQAWEKELDRLTNSSSSRGKMNYLVDGAQFFSRLFDTIQAAQESIDIRVYIFDNDHYALQIADLLKQRSKDIRVRVLIDGLGSFAAASSNSPHSPAQQGKLPNIIKYLKADSEIEIRLVDNLWLTGDHTKTILIDNKTAFIGGMNLGREYRYDWHDLMVELQGPIVDEIQYQFEKAWRLQSYLGDIRSFFYRKREAVNLPSASDIPIRLLLNSPGNLQILRSQLAAIKRSQKRIYIQNAYFTSDDILYELAKARRRGVDVRVIIPYQSDSGVINRSNVTAMNAMLANGIRVFIYPRESHIKGAIYDGWICLGSANFDRLSLRVNKETNIATSHPQAVQAFLDEIMYPDFADSVELTEPLPEKWSDFLMEIVADQL